MVTTSAFSAASAIFLRHSLRASYSLGWGGKPKRFGPRETPASKRILTSEVSTNVHIERTPKLSAAKGTTLMRRSTSFTRLQYCRRFQIKKQQKPAVSKDSFYFRSAQVCFCGR